MILTSTGATPATGTLLGRGTGPSTHLRPSRGPRGGPAHPSLFPPRRQEQAIAFAVMCTCFLAPTAWVLAHVEYYKSKGE
ncbi:hypothetical protein llap_15604 [Limosa lapponica baueri]|uniref:Uncharacterized protein n=1 Tax=Limosa lapponica baueri TaxID=1758121 RepID=A0A2I0TJV8_LIMLA|nr:hypothetical protein llap_15604 [Limosa lapponica baueri]